MDNRQVNLFTNPATLPMYQHFALNYELDTTKLFRDITEDAITGDLLPLAISYLEHCHRFLLHISLQELQQNRQHLEVYGSNYRNAQEIHHCLTQHIIVINNLLNFEGNNVTSNCLSEYDTPEKQHILTYLAQRKIINDYKAKIINYLAELVHDIENEKFKVHVMGDYFIDGMPKNVSKLLEQAKKITDVRSLADVLSLSNEVIRILTVDVPNSDSVRHFSTTNFYNKKLSEIQTLRFEGRVKLQIEAPVLNVPEINFQEIFSRVPKLQPLEYVPPPVLQDEGHHSLLITETQPLERDIGVKSRIYTQITRTGLSMWNNSPELKTSDFPRVPDQSLLTQILPNVPVPVNQDIELDDFAYKRPGQNSAS